MSMGTALQPRLDRIQGLSLFVGGGCLAICLGGAMLAPELFLPPYLVAFLFWVGLALGCVSITMLHHLVGGTWGVPIRRPLESGAMALLPMAVLFIPLCIGARTLYRWADHDFAQHHESVRQKLSYLNTGAWTARAAAYFAIWILFAFLLNRWSVRQDRTTDPAPSRWLQTLSGPGLGLVFLSATFATIDWAMSLEPEWYSTIYSAMLIVGWALETFAFAVIVAALLAEYEPLSRVVTPGMFQDLGNLMLAFVMLWAYMAFSQFLIIWAGNLAEEIPWYLRRTRGGWQWVALALALFHFFVPFFALLFRDIKRRSLNLLGVAAAILVMHAVDLTWIVIPARSIDPLGSAIPWGHVMLVPVALLGIGGIWVWVFLWSLKRKPLVLLNCPEINAAAEHEPGG